MTSRKPRVKPATSGRAPVDPKTRARVVELAKVLPPMSRNAIAREVGISSSTVSRIVAAELPEHSWGRVATKAATEAKLVDLKAARAELATDVLAEARAILAKFQAPHVKVLNHQGVGYDHPMAGPESGDVKNYAIALGILLDKHLLLVRHDSDDRDLPAVDRWLAALGVSTVVAA